MPDTNITSVIAAFTSVIVVMFVGIVIMVSAFCVYTRLHKHRDTQFIVTNDTLYDEVKQGGIDPEAGKVYEDISDITRAADGVIAATNVAYGIIQLTDQERQIL